MHASPKAYILLQKQFHLPSVSTFRRVMKNIEIYPGFRNKLLEAFKCKIKHMDEDSKLCVLLFDEISFRKALNYNVERDYIEGLEDFGLTTHSPNPNDLPTSYATVFMARGLLS
jgi:hypothetical protein